MKYKVFLYWFIGLVVVFPMAAYMLGIIIGLVISPIFILSLSNFLSIYAGFMSGLGSIFLGVVALYQNHELHRINEKNESRVFALENVSEFIPSDLFRVVFFDIDKRYYNAVFHSDQKNMPLISYNIVSCLFDEATMDTFHKEWDDFSCISISLFMSNGRKLRPESYKIVMPQITIVNDKMQKQNYNPICYSSIYREENFEKKYILPIVDKRERNIMDGLGIESDYIIDLRMFLRKKELEYFRDNSEFDCVLSFEVELINGYKVKGIYSCEIPFGYSNGILKGYNDDFISDVKYYETVKCRASLFGSYLEA